MKNKSKQTKTNEKILIIKVKTFFGFTTLLIFSFVGATHLFSFVLLLLSFGSTFSTHSVFVKHSLLLLRFLLTLLTFLVWIWYYPDMDLYHKSYKIPPNSTSDTIAMLRYFGIKTEIVGDTVLSVHTFDKYRLPKISCPKTNNPDGLIIVSYPGPPSFGLQSFSFTIDEFFSTPLDEIVSGSYARFIVSAFNISPTIVKRVYTHKKGQFKLSLTPSVNKIKKLIAMR